MSETQPTLVPSGPSPLTEADPNSLNDLIKGRIDEIMNKRPALLTDEDLRAQVQYYQRERLRFKQESDQKAASGATRGPRKKVPTSVSEALKMSQSQDLL